MNILALLSFVHCLQQSMADQWLYYPGQKKGNILVMHHVISKNLQSDFAAMHRCVKLRQSQVAFARG